MSEQITGGCLCKAVRYQASGSPFTARTCWCRLCQYIGAGSATVNVGFRAEGFTVQGVLADYASTADSGTRMHRQFCPKCGTSMFSTAESRPQIIFARAGTLDDPEIARPLSTIWTSSAPSWACIDDTIPKVERQPPPG